jgi:transposase-like protein
MNKKPSNNNKFVKLWTPQMKRRVEILFYNGASIVEVCREIGIVKKTFYNWMEAYPEFKEVVDHGMIAAESWWIERGRENVDNRKFNHALWLLMMVNRFKWHSAYAKKEEKKEIINEHKVEVKNAVDVDSILQKSIQQGIDQIDKSQVH